jgi:hypothetical protein
MQVIKDHLTSRPGRGGQALENPTSLHYRITSPADLGEEGKLWRILLVYTTGRLLTVKFRQPSHEFTFSVGMTFVSYPLVLTLVV